ncbi:MAG: hypothetical protein IKD73_00010 [Selenomonadaceae bacterium]|nr:hypothetical protein [Selenomonadaceae bacterium]
MLIKSLLERLRGKKRSPKEILQRHRQQTKSEPQQIKPLPEPTAPPPVFVLDIKDEYAMNTYLAHLRNLTAFESFLSLPWLRTRLDRVNKIIAALDSWDDFANEEFNFKLACKVREIALNMLSVYRDAKTTSSLNESSRESLRGAVEDYLAATGLTKKIFNVGDAFDEWADLGMKDSYEMTYTDKRILSATIAAIEVQPHIISYRGESGTPEQLIFGGSCRVYKFKED